MKSPIVFSEKSASTSRCTHVCRACAIPAAEHRSAPGAGTCAAREATTGAHRSQTARPPEEQLPLIAPRTAVLQIVHERFPDRPRERERGRVPGLALRHPEALAPPIDVIQRQRGDLSATQPVGDQQHQDRPVTLAARRAAIHPGQHPADLLPGDRPRDARQAIASGHSTAALRSRPITPSRCAYRRNTRSTPQQSCQRRDLPTPRSRDQRQTRSGSTARVSRASPHQSAPGTAQTAGDDAGSHQSSAAAVHARQTRYSKNPGSASTNGSGYGSDHRDEPGDDHRQHVLHRTATRLAIRRPPLDGSPGRPTIHSAMNRST